MKKFTKLLKDKKWRWTAGGVMCLALAAMFFALGRSTGAKAQSLILNSNHIDFEMVENSTDTYWIKTAEQLQAIGNASEEETNGKKFYLFQDLDLENITTVAKGTFAGEFDGQGHVITIDSAMITDNDSEETNHGLIFGTVSGIVQNVILDFKGDVSYERISSGNLEEDSENPTTYEVLEPDIKDVDMDSLQTVDGYKVYSVADADITATKNYKLVADNDYFGLLCGTNTGAIEKVYLISTAPTKATVVIAREAAAGVATTYTVPGTADVKYYYKVTESPVTKNTTGTVQLTGTVYDGRTITKSDGDVSQLLLSVSAPKVASNSIVYNVSVTGTAGRQVELKTNIDLFGNATKTTTVNIPEGGTYTDSYTYVVTGENGIVSMNLTAAEILPVQTENEPVSGDTQKTPASANVSTLVTIVGQAKAQDNKNVTFSDASIGLTGILESPNTNYIYGTDDTTYKYSLVLTNGSSNSIIIGKDGLDSWKLSGNPVTEDINIAADSSITLQRVVKPAFTSGSLSESFNETVTINASQTVTNYSYEYDPEKTVVENFTEKDGAVKTPVAESEASVSNNLYAGAVAGLNTGTIQEVKQTLNMTSESATAIGGIAGSATNGSLSDLYMLGKVNGESAYVGDGTVTVSGSASREVNSIPADGACWTTYNEYTQSASGIANVVYADLEWLVKPVQFSYGSPTSDGKINVSLADSNRITSKALENIVIGYSARKNLKDTENQSYFSDEGIIDLGESGFYKVLAAYTSDGFYHYYHEEKGDANDVIYPYKDEGPFSVESGRVVRSKFNPLEDVVELTFSPRAENGGTIYYVVNAPTTLPGLTNNPKNTPMNEQGIASFPFQEESAQYRMVAVVNNHIYPAFMSDTYRIGMKDVLPKPEVSVFNYYNFNGTKNEFVEFGTSGATYVAEEGLKIQPYSNSENTNYTFRYKFSETAPISGQWDIDNTNEHYNNRYKGESPFDMTDAVEYTDSSVIPKEFAGKENVYLYVEISKKFYNSEIYCYGPINIITKDVLTSELPSGNGYTVINGDVMKIHGAPKGATIQYFVSKTPVSSYSGAWTNYHSSNGIVMSEANGSYVYARIKYDDSKYSQMFEFACAFGGKCADPSITPNTGVPSGNTEDDEAKAASINSTTAISLSSRTENASVFYLVSDTKNTIYLERVDSDSVPTEVKKDGDCNTAKTEKYFKVGERWYRTYNTNVEKYTESFYLVNATSVPILKYISAVSVADGYEISDARNYVYIIKPAQRVERPEAAIETSFSPSEETHEIANVTLGSNITFYSVTPEVELYYAIGSGTEEPTIPMPAEGVVVGGDVTYGDNFIVRVQAKRDGMLPSEIITFLYKISEQELVSTPTATPGTSDDLPTEILPGNKILLSTTTKEALIYYTLDGSSPVVNVDEYGIFSSGNAETFLYDPTKGIDMPSEGEDYFTITAVAVNKELAQSKEAHFTYRYPEDVLAPYANFASGKVELNTKVLLKNLTEGAMIYYNVAYGETVPEDPTLSSSVFNEAYPFTITQKTTIKALSVKDNVKSEIVTFTFEPMAQLLAPTASIQSGSVVSRGTVLELKSETGATIYYTMDGSDPMDAENKAIMTGNSLVLNGEAGTQITIKAYAVSSDKSKSEVVTFTYLFSQNAGGVTASIESGSTVANGTKVNLISDVTDGDIYYTTDGSSPVSSGKKGTTVEIEGAPGSTFTLKAVVKIDGEPGIIATFVYKIQECPDAPTASPAGGVLTVATRVSLSAGTEEIYYTTDGTEPTKSSAAYSEPILINRATILKAIAVSEDGVISDVATFVYEAALKASSVKSSRADGEILEPGEQIHLTTATDGAVIYYSTNGTEPTLDNLDGLLVYDGSFIEINRNVTIQAVAYRKDLRLSDVQTWSYLVEKIPAVEQKEEEAAKLAEEGLKDTDPSKLLRENQKKTDKETKTVRERTYKTAIVYSSEAFDGNVSLETIKEEDNPYTIKKAKGIYGNNTTVLESYKVKVKSDSFGVQPKETIEIALPIPGGYEDAVLSVAFVKEDHNLTTLETRREADALYVKTDKVGSYIIIGPERANEEKQQFPYLIVLETVAGIVAAAGVIFCVTVKIKKIKKNK